jgi:hypothetical protein
MDEKLVTDALLRRFLLGNVDDEERQGIESLFLTHSLSQERVTAAEEDLTEDYLEDSLTAEDRERFLERYADSPTQQRKLRIARSIKEWAAKEGKVAQTAPATVSARSRLRERLRLRPLFVIPVAAMIVIAIALAAIWVNNSREQQNRRIALEQEVARLNSSSGLREVASTSLALRPVSVRSVEAQPELISRPDVQNVELRLLWMQKEHYPTYRAVVRRVGVGELVTVRDVQAEADGNSVRIKLPARILTRGTYQIELVGVAADGATSPAQEYQFSVT